MHTTELGLALGGGAARGLAHIGVLQELEAAGVVVTHVAGCSFGAVVGAAYVCGTLSELEERARAFRRSELIGYADVAFSGGAVRGDVLLGRLQCLTRGLRFEELPVPFAVVATDLETGSPVVLRAGPVAEAVRASMSVPGLLAPAVIDGRVLVDGGLVELVPLTALRELGATRLVAVDVSNQHDLWTQAATRVRLSVRGMRSGYLQLSETAAGLVPERARAFLTAHDRLRRQAWGLVRTVLSALDITESRLPLALPESQADLVIRPDVGRFHGHQFDRAAEIIAAGRVAVRQALPVLTGRTAASRVVPVLRSPTEEGGVAG
jgi:NTE family protein